MVYRLLLSAVAALSIAGCSETETMYEDASLENETTNHKGPEARLVKVMKNGSLLNITGSELGSLAQIERAGGAEVGGSADGIVYLNAKLLPEDSPERDGNNRIVYRLVSLDECEKTSFGVGDEVIEQIILKRGEDDEFVECEDLVVGDVVAFEPVTASSAIASLLGIGSTTGIIATGVSTLTDEIDQPISR